MALTREENDLLTRVENGAPMGRMLKQHYWFPAVPSSKLVADGAPVRVRLLGENYAAFRATNGIAGIVDEQCRHRKASLLLGRNEENGLRCIYHGWKYNAQGELLEAPNHFGDQEAFCKHIRVRRYAVREAAGIVWVWLGASDLNAMQAAQGTDAAELSPPFPDLPFTHLPLDHVAVTSQEVPTNWLQGVEASMDSSHVGVLHASTTKLSSAGTQRVFMTEALAPKLEFEDRPYGYRYAAIRALKDGSSYVRVNNYVLPWYGIICAPEEFGPATVFISTPVDDRTHRAWFVHFNMHRPIGMTNMSVSTDQWAWPPLPPGDASNNWGQNRDLMRRGHASGFPQHLGTEDFAMFLGQGALYDRSDEQLSTADGAIRRVRGQLMSCVQQFQRGHKPAIATGDIDYPSIASIGKVLPADADWRSISPAGDESTK